MKRIDPRLAQNIALGTIVAILLVLTLSPSRSNTIDFQNYCLICGERGLADAVLNIVLFMPLGLGLGARARSNLLAYSLAIAISTGIEAAQVFIPGRDSSFADIVFNALGSVLGVGLARSWRAWVLPSPGASRVLAASATVIAASVLISTDLLLRPSFPDMQYDAAFTPRLSYQAHYEGSVLRASVGPVQVADGVLAESERVRAGLLAGEPWELVIVAGGPPDGLAPIASISGFQTEIVSLSIDRVDLYYRYRMLTVPLRLDHPGLRFPGALTGVRPGRTLRIAAERDGKGYCLSAGESRRCGIGFTLGDGWSLLLWVARLPAGVSALLSLAWLSALALPAAYWSTGPRVAVASATAIGISLVLVPHYGSLLATPWPQYLAGLVGIGIGLVLQRLVRRTRP